MLQEVEIYLKGWKDRVMNMVARGFVKAVTRVEAGYLQKLQVKLLNGETIEHEQMQEYGFCSVPLPGCQNAVIFVNGSRANGIVIATDDSRYRIVLAEGEVAIYGKDGQYVKMKDGNEVEVSADKVTIASDSADVAISSSSANVTVEGAIVTVKGTTKVIVESPLTFLGGELGALKVARDTDTVVGSQVVASSLKVFAQ